MILPLERWPVSKDKWRRAEELGFHAAYTYDHLSWLRLKDRPWFGAVPTLTAAALETSRIRLGTMVTSPNFRHPVPLAKDLLSIDDVSQGRLTVGIGSGGTGGDATVLGKPAWSPLERADRFEEFVLLLDDLLRNTDTSSQGSFYSSHDALMLPGTLQDPRPPFVIAAEGTRGMTLAAQHGHGWVTIGRSSKEGDTCYDAVTSQLQRLDEVLAIQGNASPNFEKVLLDGLSDERPLVSLDAFVDWAGRYQELGITELVIHWPEPNSLFEANSGIFEKIAIEGLSQL